MSRWLFFATLDRVGNGISPTRGKLAKKLFSRGLSQRMEADAEVALKRSEAEQTWIVPIVISL